MAKNIRGMTKVYVTVNKLKVAGIYDDGTAFEFTINNDSKKTAKFFTLADSFVKDVHNLLEK